MSKFSRILFLLGMFGFLLISNHALATNNVVYPQNDSTLSLAGLAQAIDQIRQQIQSLQQQITIILNQTPKPVINLPTAGTNSNAITAQQLDYSKKLEKRVMELQAFVDRVNRTPIPNITHYLTVGSIDVNTENQVTLWQTYLINLNFLTMPSGTSNGYFGNLTGAATALWKRAVGVDFLSPQTPDIAPVTLEWVRKQIASGGGNLFGPKSSIVLYGATNTFLPFPSEGPAGTRAQLCLGQAIKKELKDILKVPTFEVAPVTAELWLNQQSQEKKWCIEHANPPFPENQIEAHYNLNSYE